MIDATVPAGTTAVTERLLTADGVLLHAHMQPATTEASLATAVVIAHGFSASARDAHVLVLRDALTGQGFDVVTYDARGHGDSEGWCTLGHEEQHDVAAAIQFARERADRVVVVGASMGAIATLRYVAAQHDVAGAVLLSCPARWRMPRSLTGLAAVALTQTTIGRYVAARHIGVRVEPRLVRAAEPALVAPDVRVPVAVVHGARDTFIPPAHADELHEALGGERMLVVVPDHGHAFGPGAVQPLCDAVGWVLAN